MNEPEIKKVDLPYRLRESAFQKYEDDIARAVKAFPSVVQFSPKGSVGTFEARLRDAISSFFDNKWKSDKIDWHVFATFKPFLVVSRWNDKVLVGEKEHIRQVKLEGQGIPSTPAVDAGTVEPFDFDTLDTLENRDVRFVCVLAAQRLLSRPIKTRYIDEDHAKLLESNYDVRIDRDSEGAWVIS